jgi:hypothetical protein
VRHKIGRLKKKYLPDLHPHNRQNQRFQRYQKYHDYDTGKGPNPTWNRNRKSQNYQKKRWKKDEKHPDNRNGKNCNRYNGPPKDHYEPVQ